MAVVCATLEVSLKSPAVVVPICIRAGRAHDEDFDLLGSVEHRPTS